MQPKIKPLQVLLALMIGALATVAPTVIPLHSNMAFAQESNEYPDIPHNHWAYVTMTKLSQVGLIENISNGVYLSYKPLTRYEFAVAVARILDKVNAFSIDELCEPGKDCMPGLSKTISDGGFVKRPELIDAISALRTEFKDELKALGVRVDGLDKRVIPFSSKPPKLTITPKTQGSGKITDDIGVEGNNERKN